MKDLFGKISLQDLYENSLEGLILLTDKAEILQYNRGFIHMVQQEPSMNRALADFISPADRRAWKKAVMDFQSGSRRSMKISCRYISGSRGLRWCLFHLKKIHNQHFQGILTTMSDTTEVKELEKRLRRAKEQAEEATKVKTEFLANTSHEIRTPIHTIIGMSELLMETPLDQEQQEYGNQIQFGATVLLSLVNDILDMSKIEAGKMDIEYTKFDLHELLTGVVDMLTLEIHKKGVEIGLFIGKDVPRIVLCDPLRLRQVLVNLINNAVKFTSKGQIIVLCHLESRQDKSGRISIQVEDSGIGIPLEKQKNLFAAFQQADSSTTRKYGGTGLGLFISRNLIAAMGGQLEFNSDPGRGSNFYFTLDVIIQEDKEEDSFPIPESFFRGIKVLLVDDNSRIRGLAAQTLRAWGCKVTEVESGEEALRVLRNPLEGPGYQVCIVDQQMPGIDGWQFASEIHSDREIQIPLILTPMKGNSTDEAKMKLLGWFDDYLTKPVKAKELLSKLYYSISRSSDDPENPMNHLELLETVTEDEYQPQPLQLNQRRILVVEDHLVNQQLFNTILSKMGCLVYCAANGLEALELADKHDPELIFMDCQMPVMNGYEATRELRNRGINAPIIAVTASAVKDERLRCTQAGMDDMLPKPFKREDLLPFLAKYLQNTQDQTEALEELEELEDIQENEVPEKSTASDVSLEELPIFDTKAALDTFLGNEEVILGLLSPFMNKVEGQVKAFKKLYDEEQWDTIRQEAHSIKGSSRNLSMIAIAQVAEIIEKAAGDKNRAPFPLIFQQLSDQFSVLKEKIESILDRGSMS